MRWIEFSPHVLPQAIACPQPAMVFHARMAAIEFCRKTLCDQRSLDPVRAYDSPVIEMESPRGTRIVKVKAVEVGGRDYTVVTPSIGAGYVRSQHPGEFCFTPDNVNIHVYPMPADTVDVVVDAALMPSLDATELADEIGNQYLQDIALGALASILMISDQPFTDFKKAGAYGMAFRARINTVAAKVARGQANSKMRSYAKFV